MKIAYILTSLDASGPIIVAKDLARLMVDYGHKVDVYYFKDTEVKLEFSCPIYHIGMGDSFNFNAYDIIHCHGLRPDIFMMIHKPWRCKTPVCTTIHSYVFSDHAFAYGKFCSKITSRIVLASTWRDDKILVLSKDMKNYYAKYFPACKLEYAYNTRVCSSDCDLSDEEKKELLAFKGNGRLLCSVSGLNQRKGLHQIIRALSRIPDVKYCVVGDGTERKPLEELAESLGVADCVLFVGNKPDGFRYLKYADVFVMPSYSEGFPLAMLEAASMGKAILCSNIPVFREIFTEEEVAVFEIDNLDSLCTAIGHAIANKDVLAENAHRKFEIAYTPECFYARHLAIYQSLIHLKS